MKITSMHKLIMCGWLIFQSTPVFIVLHMDKTVGLGPLTEKIYGENVSLFPVLTPANHVGILSPLDFKYILATLPIVLL